ncbi:MAG: DUF6252 family protein [Flavobacteriaceae bacterium]
MKATKNIFKLFLLALVLVACNAEDPAELDATLHGDDSDTPQESAGTFTANIEGSPYEIDIATAVVANGVITITGKRGNEVVTLRMPSNIAVNSVTNPYVLGGAASTYAAFYNTGVTEVSEATTSSDLQMEFDFENDGENDFWKADTPLATILNGETVIKGIRVTSIDTGNLDNGVPVFADVTQELEMVLQETDSGAYQFGTINTAQYFAGGAGGDVFEADMTMDNGNVTIEVDTENKLISGSFNFDGTETYTSNAIPLTGTDTDGDGMFDGAHDVPGTELYYGYNINDACSPVRPAGYTGYNSNNAIWNAADCDGDGITNGDELIAGTDPYEGNVDSDGDGLSDEQEDLDGTDSSDPCDPVQLELYNFYDATNSVWMAGDCDGDTISNGDEVANGTDPYFMDFQNKSFTSGEFKYVPYLDGGTPVKRGLNISTHDIVNKHIVGTYSFISASIGENPTRWYLVTDGTFDVIYTEN